MIEKDYIRKYTRVLLCGETIKIGDYRWKFNFDEHAYRWTKVETLHAIHPIIDATNVYLYRRVIKRREG